MFNLILLTFATWRLGSLIRNESGPYKIFDKFRDWAGITEVYEGEDRVLYGNGTVISEILECFWCLSIWVAMFICVLAAAGGLITWQQVFFSILATSAISIIIEEKIFN